MKLVFPVSRFAGLLLVAAVAAAARPTSVAAAEPGEQRNVVYRTVGETALAADVYRGVGDGPRPGVLLLHGGGWAFGSKAQMAFLARMLAEAGFTAVSVDYRLAPKHPFPAQFEDATAAVRWMRRDGDRLGIRPDWIAAYGYSAGGHLALLLGLNAAEAGPETDEPATVQAVVAGGAPCDFRQLPLDTPVLSYWLGGTRRERPALYEQASPSAFARGDAPPIHFFHGAKDQLVSSASSRGLFDRLQGLGASAEYDEIVDGGHLRTFGDRQAARRAINFLRRQVYETESKAVASNRREVDVE